MIVILLLFDKILSKASSVILFSLLERNNDTWVNLGSPRSQKQFKVVKQKISV